MRTTLFDLVCQEGIVDEDHPEEEHVEDPYDVERILEVKDTQEVQVHSPIAHSFNAIGTLELGFKKPALKKKTAVVVLDETLPCCCYLCQQVRVSLILTTARNFRSSSHFEF